MNTATDAVSWQPPTGVVESRLLDLPLVHGPTAARTARRIVREVLIGWGVSPDSTDDAVLVVSELATNAVTHARPPVTLHVRLGGRPRTLFLSVADGGTRPVGLLRNARTAPYEHGRGRQVIAAVTTATGSATDIDSDGTVHHWATLSLTPA